MGPRAVRLPDGALDGHQQRRPVGHLQDPRADHDDDLLPRPAGRIGRRVRDLLGGPRGHARDGPAARTGRSVGDPRAVTGFSLIQYGDGLTVTEEDEGVIRVDATGVAGPPGPG